MEERFRAGLIISQYNTASSVSDVSLAEAKTFFTSLHFLGPQSEQLRDELLLLLNNFYLSFDFRIVLVNSLTISRVFNDVLQFTSSVVRIAHQSALAGPCIMFWSSGACLQKQ